MKKKIISAVILALVMIFSTIPAFAAETPYEYTVTVYAGAHGTVNGKESDSITVPYNTKINLNDYFTAELKKDSSRYYIKRGNYRLSGRDNNTVVTPIFTVTGDMDFVVAYGIEGKSVRYKVEYVDIETKKPLADPNYYYGNVGDKPVEAYLYIDGYRPRYENLTKTLVDSEKEEDNTFTFEYIKVEEPEEETTTQEETTTRQQATQQQTTTSSQTTRPGTTTTTTTTTRPGTTTTNPGGTTTYPGGTTQIEYAPGGPGGDDDEETTGDFGYEEESTDEFGPDDEATDEFGTDEEGTDELGPDEEGTGVENPQDIQTEELGDLDVPLANPENQQETSSTSGVIEVSANNNQANAGSPISPILWVIIGVVVAAIIAFLIWFLTKNKKQNKDDL